MALRDGWVFVAVMALAPSAQAHDVKDPRVIIVVATKERIELRINEITSVPESEKLRRGFDANHDGALDDSELSDLTSFLALRSTANLSVEQEGAKLALTTDSRVLKNAGSRVDATDPLSVDVVLRASPAGARGVAIVMKDWRSDDHAVRIAVLANGVSLESVSAGQLDAKRGLATGISLDRTRALTLRYTR